ncbi:MAG TPA: prepilin peptidase, partial [Pseudomonadales bacterium]|nr:prepilin peptidase [Pseudomonadales bacterium]
MDLVSYLQATPSVFVAVAALLGLIVGSLLNVVIHRVPIMMETDWRRQCLELNGAATKEEEPSEAFNLLRPGSRCPHCGHAIRPWENIPLVSYLLLRGKCSECG